MSTADFLCSFFFWVEVFFFPPYFIYFCWSIVALKLWVFLCVVVKLICSGFFYLSLCCKYFPLVFHLTVGLVCLFLHAYIFVRTR